MTSITWRIAAFFIDLAILAHTVLFAMKGI